MYDEEEEEEGEEEGLPARGGGHPTNLAASMNSEHDGSNGSNASDGHQQHTQNAPQAPQDPRSYDNGWDVFNQETRRRDKLASDRDRAMDIVNASTRQTSGDVFDQAGSQGLWGDQPHTQGMQPTQHTQATQPTWTARAAPTTLIPLSVEAPQPRQTTQSAQSAHVGWSVAAHLSRAGRTTTDTLIAPIAPAPTPSDTMTVAHIDPALPPPIVAPKGVLQPTGQTGPVSLAGGGVMVDYEDEDW